MLGKKAKGLDDRVKLKPSLVDWIGDIPEGWRVKKLKYSCEQFQWAVYGANIPAEEYATEGVRFLRTSDFNDFGFIKNDSAVYIPKLLA